MSFFQLVDFFRDNMAIHHRCSHQNRVPTSPITQGSSRSFEWGHEIQDVHIMILHWMYQQQTIWLLVAIILFQITFVLWDTNLIVTSRRVYYGCEYNQWCAMMLSNSRWWGLKMIQPTRIVTQRCGFDEFDLCFTSRGFTSTKNEYLTIEPMLSWRFVPFGGRVSIYTIFWWENRDRVWFWSRNGFFRHSRDRSTKALQNHAAIQQS